MGILDAFRKKKDDGFGQSGDLGSSQLDQGQGFPGPGQGFGQQQTFNDDPLAPQPQQYGQYQQPQQYGQAYPSQQYPGQQQEFSPEQAGFERIQPGQGGFPQRSSGSSSVNDISMGRDFELINAKLDAIKAELDSVNQRLKRMERLNDEPPKKDNWY